MTDERDDKPGSTDAKPAAAEPADAKSEAKASEAQAGDVKSDDAKSDEVSSGDAKPADAKSSDAESADATSGDAESRDAKPAAARSDDAKAAARFGAAAQRMRAGAQSGANSRAVLRLVLGAVLVVIGLIGSVTTNKVFIGSILAGIVSMIRGFAVLKAPIVDTTVEPEGEPDDEGAPKREPEDGWDYAANWFFTKGALPTLALITIGCGVMYGRLFWGEIAGDDLTFHMAEAARISDCLSKGDFNLWNPSGNAGYASAYYYQVLPQLFSAVPAALFGHLLFWFQLSNWLPLVAGPLCSYRGMRLMGASPWQAVIGAGCVAMMNCESRWGAGASGSFHVGLYTQTWALCAFPLALGYGAHWLTKGGKLGQAVFWGIFCGLCHPFAVVGLGLAFVVAVGIQLLLAPLDLLFQMIGRSVEPIAPQKRPEEFVGRFVHDIAMRWKKLPGMKRLELKPFIRLAILGGLMLLAFMPVWLPLLVDYEGFGGFPHRVGDEIGPGFKTLADWHFSGKILDYADPKSVGFVRWPILTYLLIPVLVFARGPYLRWLVTPALFYVLLLGLGPHIGATQDDLLPMVRFLGAMQTVLALTIGAGVVGIGVWIWKAVDGAYFSYAIRTTLIAIATILAVLVGYQGTRAQIALVHVMPEWENQHHDELLQVAAYLKTQPEGRKQVASGAENHWWNLLTYIYGRTPSLLQMGGGGLQASPNYDYLWYAVTQWHDLPKTAWLYDAPYLVYARQYADKVAQGEVVFDTHVKKAEFVDPNDKNWFWPNLKVVDALGNYEVRWLPANGLVSPVQVTGVLPAGARKGQPGREAALAWLKGPGPVADHVLAYDGYGPSTDAVPHGRVLKSWYQDSPGDDPDIVAQVDVDQPTTFVVRESWHPRWRAYIDGEPAPVRRVTPDFPAVDVPPGHHELSLRFERPWWAWASWLAWPGTALAAGFVLRRRARSRLPEARVVR